ncbi:MAG: 4-hydroxythreonine-4-phosphate dehydrogenase PdxA [Desulfovibrionaceae bacterium]|nr:4-hydroxythreonine-4-phosphate dehydrogenase PdxA [Desulfovibrionaceae bacterium]
MIPNNSNNCLPLILVAMGDPDGVGPELLCRALPVLDAGRTRLVMIGPESALAAHLARRGQKPFYTRIQSLDEMADAPGGTYHFTPPGLADFGPRPGTPRPEGGRAAALSLDAAMPALLGGQASALVTCPLNKHMLREAGYPFPGHTEFLAVRSGLPPDAVCMHLCGDILRVSLVTTHPRLADVPGLVTFDRVLDKLRLTWDFLRTLNLAGKPIAVCGLNPHAGESGSIGDEEIRAIAPAAAEANRLGISAVGPLPADTVFSRAAAGEFSAVLAMYHDQGLGPLKLLHFNKSVNVTLGLPFIRTSVDHGTAYDLTGQDTASTQSLTMAIELAPRLADPPGAKGLRPLDPRRGA